MTGEATGSARVSAADLRGDPLLDGVPNMRLASVLAHVDRLSLPAGAEIFAPGAPADRLYRILGGRVRLEEAGDENSLGNKPRNITLSTGYLGEESVLGAPVHSMRAVAEDAVDLLAIPSHVLREIAKTDEDLQARLFRSFAARFETKPPSEDTPHVTPAPPAEPGQDRREHVTAILGWLCAIALPALVYATGPTLGLSPGATDFLAIISATICMWLFGLVPEYVPPLFASLAVILLDVAPPEEALSGFRSESFFMCLSVFGLGTLLVSSGLTYRFALWVLARVPPTQAGYNASLFGLGVLLSPIIPSVVGRVSIVSPFLIELIEISKAGPRDLYANRLIYSMLGGSALLVPIFLTASVPNLVVYGLLDPQTQFAFDWMSWLGAGAVYGLVMVLVFTGVSALAFRGARHFSVPRHILREQNRILGPVSVTEWLALAAVLTMGLGVVTEAIHRVDFPWVALAIFVTLLLFGSLKRDALRTHIDWPVLVYIGAIVGWVPIAASTGLDAFVVTHLAWLGTYMEEDLPLFILMVSAVILLIRLALPTGVTVVLLATALFPVAGAEGISLWVIGFIILAVADTFIFPYQSSYYLKLRNDLADRGRGAVCDTPRLVATNVVLILARIGALQVCLVFWSMLDLI